MLRTADVIRLDDYRPSAPAPISADAHARLLSAGMLILSDMTPDQLDAAVAELRTRQATRGR